MKIKFNKNQGLAIRHGNGPCLVLAGPGSGKTFVITQRLKELITGHNVDPNSILVITFTRNAALEMKERFLKLLKEEKILISDIPTFGTFHSVFFDILKESFGYNSESLICEKEEVRYLFSIIEKYRDINASFDMINLILKEIKSYKLAKERGENYRPKNISSRLFYDIIDRYDELLFNNKKLDFTDMIDKCRILLKENPDELAYYQNKYKYILIDEFQDINAMQYDVVRLLSKTKNIFVVGDDDQSIYRFRGSHPRVMHDFLADYKGTKLITLSENYRCAKNIVRFSKYVISYNVDRFDKDLKSLRDSFGKLEIKAFVDSAEENEYIISNIKNYIKNGFSYRDIAILYRTNLLSHSIRLSLNKFNIPFSIKGDTGSILDNFAIKTVLSYLRYSINDKDIESLMDIANKPLRYISRDAMLLNKSGISDLIKYYRNKDFMLTKITKFKHDLYVIRKLVTPIAIRYIRVNVGYDNYIKEYCRIKDIDYDEISGLLDTLEEESITHSDIFDFLKYIDSYNKNESKVNRKQEIDSNELDCVSLMTFHLSKGLEFKVVFIIDANDGLIPHKKSIKDDDIETERRLFYVGLTRAKDFLHVFFTTRRFGKNYKASRFILEAIGGKDYE